MALRVAKETNAGTSGRNAYDVILSLAVNQ